MFEEVSCFCDLGFGKGSGVWALIFELGRQGFLALGEIANVIECVLSKGGAGSVGACSRRLLLKKKVGCGAAVISFFIIEIEPHERSTDMDICSSQLISVPIWDVTSGYRRSGINKGW